MRVKATPLAFSKGCTRVIKDTTKNDDLVIVYDSGIVARRHERNHSDYGALPVPTTAVSALPIPKPPKTPTIESTSAAVIPVIDLSSDDEPDNRKESERGFGCLFSRPARVVPSPFVPTEAQPPTTSQRPFRAYRHSRPWALVFREVEKVAEQLRREEGERNGGSRQFEIKQTGGDTLGKRKRKSNENPDFYYY